MKKLLITLLFAGGINNPDASVGAQCSMFRTVCSIRWLQSALIPFVTTQSVAEDRQVLNPLHE